MNYTKEKLRKIFENSNECDCGSQDCESNHRICYICGEKIQWGEYIGNDKHSDKSGCQWDVDHVKPNRFGNNNDISNLQATHPWCNKDKGNNNI